MSLTDALCQWLAIALSALVLKESAPLVWTSVVSKRFVAAACGRYEHL